MANFKQIEEWFSSISKLSLEVTPTIDRIRQGVNTKEINGVQFIDQQVPSLSNIQELNKILKENGLEGIDESLFSSTAVDIEQIARRMQNDFSESELADASTGPVQDTMVRDFSQIDLELADICAPSQPDQTPDFTETELIEVACEIPDVVQRDVDEIELIPTTRPVQDLNLNSTALPNMDDSSFDFILDQARNAPESTIFPTNGADCISKMRDIARSVQESTKRYVDVKNRLQEIQLDYYYESIANSYYQSFLSGYSEVDRIRSEIESASRSNNQIEVTRLQSELSLLRDRYDFASDASAVQSLLEEAIWSFSNQFDIEIDTGFLGLFESSPIVRINRDKAPLTGVVRDIPDALNRYIDGVDKGQSDAAKKITNEAKRSAAEIERSFESTVSDVRRISFAFGLNRFIDGESIDDDFREQASSYSESYKTVSSVYLDLKKIESDIDEELSGIEKKVTTELGNMNCKQQDLPTKVEPGGNLNFKNVSTNPTIFDYSWWVKFSTFATLVNLVPVHWPVGLLIPSPSGIIRIPFPIIWIPVFVAPTDKLVAVLFIGQCGILPCPYLFLQHFLPLPVGQFESNNPYFAAAIGGPVNISSHEPIRPSTLPNFNLVFGPLNIALNNFRNGVTVDISSLIAGVQNQLDAVKNSVDRYVAVSQLDVNEIIENGKRQATQILQSAKLTAEETIRQAQQDGQRMIDDARQRYRDSIALSEVTLSISRGVQEKISAANELIEEARRIANNITINAKIDAEALAKRVNDTVNGIIENGRAAYRQKIEEIRQIGERVDEVAETLGDLIDRINVPILDISSINLSALLSSYSLSLGSMASLAANLSPKAIQFGFPTEISPAFSASLPMFVDEFPTWERLSILNIPFLFFLWKWCKAGKFVGGFFPESIFGPV